MSIKSTQIFLVAGDARKDARRLQKAIPGEPFAEWNPVNIEHLKETLQRFKRGDPNLILLDKSNSPAVLATTLSRLRKIASRVPVLVLPREWNTLNIPTSPYASKSQSDVLAKHVQLARLLRDGLRRMQSQTELTRLALCDDLTGLYNRRGFQALGSQLLKMASRRKKNLLLFFADLDNLKNINDKFGHQEGDRALLHVADIFRRTFRSVDITARFGGDEFVALVIEDCDQTETTISKRLQRNLADCAAKQRSYLLSFTFGTAQCFSSGRSSLQRLLTQADHSLYEQKRTRRAGPSGDGIVPFPRATRHRVPRRLATPGACSFAHQQAIRVGFKPDLSKALEPSLT